jgi:hypothetical protein
VYGSQGARRIDPAGRYVKHSADAFDPVTGAGVVVPCFDRRPVILNSGLRKYDAS